jgi:hypothetical protein
MVPNPPANAAKVTICAIRLARGHKKTHACAVAKMSAAPRLQLNHGRLAERVSDHLVLD